MAMERITTEQVLTADKVYDAGTTLIFEGGKLVNIETEGSWIMKVVK